MSNEIEQLQADLARIQKIGEEVEALFTPAEIGPEGGTWQVRIGRGVASLRDQLAARDALITRLTVGLRLAIAEMENAAPRAWANGVTDDCGTTDEGEVMHGRLMKHLKTIEREQDTIAADIAKDRAELARLRELEANHKRLLKVAYDRYAVRLSEFEKDSDALRAQLAERDARIEELTDEHTELAGKLDMACHRAEKAEARLRAVNEALAAYQNALFDGPENLSAKRAGELNEQANAARSGDLPPRITAARLAEVIKCAYIIHGRDWREVAEMVLPQLGDLPPHPDTARLDWLEKNEATKDFVCQGFRREDGSWVPSQWMNLHSGHPRLIDSAQPTLRAAIDAARAQEGGAE